MAETLRPRKVPEAKIRITGIPIRAGFDTDYNREEELEKFNLPTDKLVVLVMAGASLPQPYVRFRAEMDRTLPFLRSSKTCTLSFCRARIPNMPPVSKRFSMP